MNQIIPKKLLDALKDEFLGKPENSDDAVSKLPALLPALEPRHRKKKTLVLDLDETLIHGSFQVGPEDPEPDQKVQIKSSITGKICTVNVYERPKVREFLKEMAKHFEVVIFTAS